MFTGLIESLGTISEAILYKKGKRIRVCSTLVPHIREGDSIAIDGVCSTAIRLSQTGFGVDFLEETLKKTTMGSLKEGQAVNLELALTPSSRMGGHFVTGHVDEVGEVLACTKDGPWVKLTVSFSSKNRFFLIEKGSIAIDGVSLTIVALSTTSFTCHLIPHTQTMTRLAMKKKGDFVNLEYDMLAKYLHTFYTLSQSKPGGFPNEVYPSI